MSIIFFFDINSDELSEALKLLDRKGYLLEYICKGQNVLEPIFVKWFINNTYSCIKGRGIHKLASDIERDFRKHSKETAWCLKLDIHKFYPRILRHVLMSTIQRKIKDTWLIKILSEIIRRVYDD